MAYIVALTFGIAASCNFPVLIMAMFWKGLTTRGALAGGYAGLIGSVVLILTGPTVWVKVLGNSGILFPYDNPAIFTIPTAFIVAWLVSKTDNSAQAAAEHLLYDDQFVRSQTGIGIDAAAAH